MISPLEYKVQAATPARKPLPLPSNSEAEPVMTEEQRTRLRDDIEREARKEGWLRFRVTVRNTKTGREETLEVPGRNARHASRTNAMFLLEMPLRGELVEYEVEELN